MKTRWLVLLAAPVLAGCVKDRDLVAGEDGGGGSPPATIGQGYLYINEFVATGSVNLNEFGTAEDWMEIYNPSASAVMLAADRWYVSDAGPTQPMKYALPEVTVPAHGHLLIWCDNLNTVATQIHTNFGLSSQGEHLVLFYDDGGDGVIVDDYLFDAQTVGGASMGRSPDGGSSWVQFLVPTPGEANP